MDRDLKKLKLNEALSLAKQTSEPSVIIELSRHPNATMRKRCLVEMCPCRVECDIEAFWSRIFEMVEDTDALVRAQVLHTLCDGSPKHLENSVIEALEKFNKDEDSDVRRKAHRVLSSYKRKGKWNIL